MRLDVLLFVAAFASPSWAQAQSTDHAAHHQAPSTAVTQPMVEGEVRKVDKETGRLTLRHGPIPNLDMPDMTMVFRVKDRTMLDRVKAGDKVQFSADKVNGVYTVTNVEVVK